MTTTVKVQAPDYDIKIEVVRIDWNGAETILANLSKSQKWEGVAYDGSNILIREVTQ